MKSTSFFLQLACSIAIVTGSLQDQSWAQDAVSSSSQLRNRFGRALSQVDGSALEGIFPLYLIPTSEPGLCVGPTCCQADDFSSPYRVRHLTSSKVTSAGQAYTTFYMRLAHQQWCIESTDKAGCCQSDIQTIWIDVDPKLKVLYTTLDGSPSAIEAQQSDMGFRMTLAQRMQDVTGSGSLITVTVEGEVDILCAPSDLAPVFGLCSIIVEGSGTNAACCPQSLSQAFSSNVTFVPTKVECVSNAAVSGFELVLQSATLPFGSAANMKSNYTFVLYSTDICSSDVANSCCNMDVNTLQIDISADAVVTSMELDGTVLPFTVVTMTTSIPTAGSQVRTLVVENLALRSSMVPSMGLPLLITIQLPSGSNAVPHLCPVSTDVDLLGPCSYALRSTSKFCCPESHTGSVLAGNNVLSPPPPSPPRPPGATDAPPPPSVLAQPPPPAKGEESGPPPPPTADGTPSPPFAPVPLGSCDPSSYAPIYETSMGLQYYEGPTNLGDSTNFVFMVSNHHSSTCTKPVCQDACSWTLFVNPQLTSQLSFIADDSITEAGLEVTAGDNASFTFTFPSLKEGTLLYSATAPRQLPLSQLCRANALPGQGSKACAAIIRGPLVYSTVFFDQSDVIITAGPSAEFCSDQKQLSSSCIQVDDAQYNSASGNTIFDFALSDHTDRQPGCMANGDNATFMVLLSEPAAAQLAVSGQTKPGSGVVVNNTGGTSGLAWPWTSSIVHYSFNVNGIQTPSEVCAQGVLPGQAAGSCVVAVMGGDCFSGYLTVTLHPDLEWSKPEGDRGGSSSGATVGIAVGVTLGVLFLALLALLILFAYRRKKKNNNTTAASIARRNLNWNSFDELTAPLTSGVSAQSLSRSSAARSEVAPSGVQVRLPSSPIH